MRLDLSPHAASILEHEASRAGMSVDALIEQTFSPRPQPQPAPVETHEETDKRVQALLTKWQKEAGLPQPVGGSKTLAELRAEWAIEDANMTAEERAAESVFWEEHTQAMLNSPGVSI